MKKIFFTSIALVLLGYSLYATDPGNKGADQCLGESGSVTAAYESNRLTVEQMLSDYDAMWAAMRESYPFWGVLARKRPNDPNYYEKVISEYREKLSRAVTPSDASMLDFLSIVAYSLYDVCGSVGHVSIINPDNFKGLDVYRKYLDSMPEVQPWVTAIDKPEVISFYGYFEYLMASIAEKKQAEKDSGNGNGNGESPESRDRFAPDNLTLKILKEGETAYIRIDSFDDAYIESDVPRIRSFMDGAKDYQNIIIDIRDNGGGNTDYWEKAFVRPNIPEPVSARLIRLMKDTELTRRFYGPQYEGSTVSAESILADPRYGALPKADAQGLTKARDIVSATRPESPKKLFTGKFWVLIGPSVYSSAEAFAVFCKDTGFATLVGKTTGGSDSGGPILFELPESHLLVQFDVEYCLNADGSCNQETGTAPDIEAEDALSSVLDLIESR